MRHDGYYILSDYRTRPPSRRVYHDPSRFAASTGDVCPMLQDGHADRYYEHVEEPPKGHRFCARCDGMTGGF